MIGEKRTSLAALSPPIQDGLYVAAVGPNTPAFKAGIRSLDLIATVDGKVAKVGCFAYREKDKHLEIVVHRVKKDKSDEIRWTEVTISLCALPVPEIAAAMQSHDVTMEHFLRIRKGMTEKDVEEIFGFPGSVDATAGGDGFSVKGVTWQKKVPDSIVPKSISVNFLDGKVDSKQYIGL